MTAMALFFRLVKMSQQIGGFNSVLKMIINFNYRLCLRLLLATYCLTTSNCFGAANLEPVDLRCEYKQNPTAIDQTAPRLSWVVEAGKKQRDVFQSAYRILVASTSDLLKDDQGDLWDSGKVNSDQSIQIAYAGKVLLSGQSYFWKVELWDEKQNTSHWSEPAKWTMGLLDPADWKAKWIGFNTSSPAKKFLSLEDCDWFWANGSSPGDQPTGKVYFRKMIELPTNQSINRATFILTADDSFQLFINGQLAGKGSRKHVFDLDVASLLQPGTNLLSVVAINEGDNPNPAGLVGRLFISSTNDAPQIITIDDSWQTSREAGTNWNLLKYNDLEWKPASKVAHFGDSSLGTIPFSIPDPAPFFRKTFAIDKPIKRATVFASALGVYELHLNGRCIDNDVLSPGWTDFNKRVHYLGYDVTQQLKQGQNVFGAILGDGWYASYIAFTGKRHYYGGDPRLLVQLKIEYQDGTSETLGTDASWKAATGPILQADLLSGCIYDARAELKNWDKADFDDRDWSFAQVDENVKANLLAHPGEPIRRLEKLPAQTLNEPKPGIYVFNLNQNMVGWARLKLDGNAGQKITVRYAERLNPDGTIYTDNLRGARAIDTFFLDGKSKRDYEPYFTFHGFQYVEITGLSYKPALHDVTGIVVHSDLQRTGWFECSEPLVNKLVSNSLWGQKGNFLDVPTDCPQRDERAGWTGDAQVFMKTACLNMDSPAFYTKWLADLCDDSQRANGAFCDVAPPLSEVDAGNAGWSDSAPLCNWRMFEMYDDTRVMREHYAELVRYMGYLAATSTNFTRGTGDYGDWLRLAGPQNSDIIGTEYYFYTAHTMSGIAAVLGEETGAEKYNQLAQNIRAAFVQNYIQPDGTIRNKAGETGQTIYALAFGLDLVPAKMKDKVAKQFVATVKEQNDHLATGFLGTPFVLFALQKAGHPELAYKILLNKTYPSWLQQILWGSTSMWERWDGWRPDKGFQDPGMNSFNHYWLGCVSEWLFTQAAGIDPDGPGFQQITIHPEIVNPKNGFDWVKASYDSIHGKITSAWKLKNNRLQMAITIPGNCTATVFIPTKDARTITEGGKPARQVAGITFLRMEGHEAIFQISSGHYDFESEQPGEPAD
jgi:alpha-L-rhamnosidase